MQTENKYLHIQGIVKEKTLLQLLGPKIDSKQNTGWFFVDYSPVEYKLNTKFDIILAGEQKKMLPEFFNIKLIDVIEQTGKHLKAIPLGWKTICRFEFNPHMPSAVGHIPILSSWTDKSKIKFARHEDIVVDPFNLSKDVYTEVINDFVALSIHTSSINKKNKINFLDIFSKIIHDNRQEMKNKISNPNLIEDVKKRELHLHE